MCEIKGHNWGHEVTEWHAITTSPPEVAAAHVVEASPLAPRRQKPVTQVKEQGPTNPDNWATEAGMMRAPGWSGTVHKQRHGSPAAQVAPLQQERRASQGAGGWVMCDVGGAPPPCCQIHMLLTSTLEQPRNRRSHHAMPAPPAPAPTASQPHQTAPRHPAPPPTPAASSPSNRPPPSSCSGAHALRV